jgi:hypothetical protein
MAAVIDLHTGQQVPQFDQDPPRPQLRLVQGGRSSQALVARRTYLRRRLLAGVAAVVLVLVLAQVLGAVAGSLAGAFDSPPPASAQVHVVRPGDTLWTLAADLAPGIDRRVAVDDLLALNGDGPLRVGQELRLPASFG